MLGDASTRDRIIENLPVITNSTSRYLAALSIDRLTPREEAEVIAKLALVARLEGRAR
jgi:hypothetical protein